MACSITDHDSVVLTGGSGGSGYKPTSKVLRYDLAGWRKDESALPSLNTGRRGHGCAGYHSDGVRVGISEYFGKAEEVI